MSGKKPSVTERAAAITGRYGVYAAILLGVGGIVTAAISVFGPRWFAQPDPTTVTTVSTPTSTVTPSPTGTSTTTPTLQPVGTASDEEMISGIAISYFELIMAGQPLQAYQLLHPQLQKHSAFSPYSEWERAVSSSSYAISENSSEEAVVSGNEAQVNLELAVVPSEQQSRGRAATICLVRTLPGGSWFIRHIVFQYVDCFTFEFAD